jgi:hypothetical protein
MTVWRALVAVEENGGSGSWDGDPGFIRSTRAERQRDLRDRASSAGVSARTN